MDLSAQTQKSAQPVPMSPTAVCDFTSRTWSTCASCRREALLMWSTDRSGTAVSTLGRLGPSSGGWRARFTRRNGSHGCPEFFQEFAQYPYLFRFPILDEGLESFEPELLQTA